MVPSYAFYPHRATATATAHTYPERFRSQTRSPSAAATAVTEKSSLCRMRTGESTPLLESEGKRDMPSAAPFASALKLTNGVTWDAVPRRMPQTIAHRGYKAAFPENTMAAFKSAVEIGAHAIETDLHLTKDGVVVLSHDGTLKRCFGDEAKLKDCDWKYVSTLRTLRAPEQPMPRLVDLLEYLAQPAQQHTWILLDIKRDDDPNELIGQVAAAIASVPSNRPWNERIVMGCWNADNISLCMKLLPGFPIAYIGWSISYARELLALPNVNFNMLQWSLTGPMAARFLKDARKAGRLVWDWTVNDEDWMKWSIKKGLDGVITDDPKLFLEICDRWTKGGPGARSTTTRFSLKGARQAGGIVIFHVAAVIAAAIFLLMNGSPRKRVRKALYS